MSDRFEQERQHELEMLRVEYEADLMSAREYSTALEGLRTQTDQVALETKRLQTTYQDFYSTLQGVGTVAKNVSNLMDSLYSALNDVLDISMGNVDEQVNMYNAQINTVRQQNLYTQALAIHATAVQLFGQNSIEASRTQIGVNYQQALLNQAQKNQTLTTIQYQTAYIKNLADVANAAVNAAKDIIVLVAAINVLSGSSIAGAGGSLLGRLGLGLGGAGGAGEALGGLGDIEAAGELGGGAALAGGLGTAALETGGIALLAYGGWTLGRALGSWLRTGRAPSLGDLGYLATNPTAAGYGSGGQVQQTGYVYAHKGEWITRPESTPEGVGGVNVPITIQVSSEVDLAKVRQVVSEAIAQAQLKTIRSRGGVYT